jgi:GINS complex subunit 2
MTHTQISRRFFPQAQLGNDIQLQTPTSTAFHHTSTSSQRTPRLMSSSCFYSAFEADDTRVEIIPSFDFDKLSLLSTTVGPLKAGMPVSLPLWVALFLSNKSLCSISPPKWLTVENLAFVVEYERTSPTLWSQVDRLPHHYYELASRLRKHLDPSIPLLVQDLLEVRMDKLRQQFQQLLPRTTDDNLLVSINGIASQELAILQPFIIQALSDEQFLQTKSQPEETAMVQQAPTVRSRVPIRRFRS